MASVFAAPTATPPPGTQRQPWSRTTRSCHEQGGETAAVRALLEQVPVAGRLLTIDALYTTRETARLIVTTHAADYLVTAKKNAPEPTSSSAPATGSGDATGHFREPVGNAHGRIRATRHRVLTRPNASSTTPTSPRPVGLANRCPPAAQRRTHPGVDRALSATHQREPNPTRHHLDHRHGSRMRRRQDRVLCFPIR